MASPILKYFAFAHLPPHLQAVSKPIGELAQEVDDQLPDGPEKSAGLRKLLEAKDCFVRAAVGLLALLFALTIAVPPAAAEVPWHLQPMDTWKPGECYRSPNVSTIDRDDAGAYRRWKAQKDGYENDFRQRKSQTPMPQRLEELEADVRKLTVAIERLERLLTKSGP